MPAFDPLTIFFFAFVSTCEQRPANLSVSNVSAQCSSSADMLSTIREASSVSRYLRAYHADVRVTSKRILQEMRELRVAVWDVTAEI